MDHYRRLYGECRDSRLWRTMLAVAEIGAKYVQEAGDDRHKYRLVARRSENGTTESSGLNDWPFDLLHDVWQFPKILEEDSAAQFGPLLAVDGPDAPVENPHILAFDLDRNERLCGFELPRTGGLFSDSGLGAAARACRRDPLSQSSLRQESPEKTGIWLCYFLPGSCTGPDPDTGLYGWLGFLVGFAVLEDRDNDGKYERLNHIWTASTARRKGVARALVAYAREHFPVKKVDEWPFLSDAGRALFNAVWPEALDRAATASATPREGEGAHQ
jgi:hypothetical protein